MESGLLWDAVDVAIDVSLLNDSRKAPAGSLWKKVALVAGAVGLGSTLFAWYKHAHANELEQSIKHKKHKAPPAAPRDSIQTIIEEGPQKRGRELE